METKWKPDGNQIETRKKPRRKSRRKPKMKPGGNQGETLEEIKW